MGVKQVIVVRKDLPMRKGKTAAQVAHASMAFIAGQLDFGTRNQTLELSDIERQWLDGRFRKIVAYVNSEAELHELQDKATEAGIAIYPIIDAGFTEFKEPTFTCCAFGPDDDEKLDAITGHLKLL